LVWLWLVLKELIMITVKYVLKRKLITSAGNTIYLSVNPKCTNTIANKTYDITWPIFENRIAHLIRNELDER
jgi:hypothetical protein